MMESKHILVAAIILATLSFMRLTPSFAAVPGDYLQKSNETQNSQSSDSVKPVQEVSSDRKSEDGSNAHNTKVAPEEVDRQNTSKTPSYLDTSKPKKLHIR